MLFLGTRCYLAIVHAVLFNLLLFLGGVFVFEVIYFGSAFE